MDHIDTGIIPSTGPVSDAVRDGRLFWTVVIAEDPRTGAIEPGGIEAQTRRALLNLDMALKAAGGTLANVVQVQVFLIERADAKGMNTVYAEFFKAPYPVRATVVVKELLADGLRIEILAQAVIGD
jgi:enamine deaminase RidA (YjgF/YER057c/UK114 family)